jgi:hypothetical protein
VLALVLPAAAAAACPTGADLARGIALHGADGSVETYRRTGPHRVEARYVDRAGNSATSQLQDGLYLLSSVFRDAGDPTPIETSYGYPAGAFPPPEPGTRWEPTLSRTDPYGVTPLRQTYRFSRRDPVVIGDCRYQAVAVDSQNGEWHEVLAWLPDLGLAFVERSGVQGDSLTRYRFVAIVALEGG